MKVKVIKCSYDGYWYVGLVGKTVDVLEPPSPDHYHSFRCVNKKLRSDGHPDIFKKDCEVIHE